MGWPTLIQLYTSEHSVSYNGTELRETWYVEPYDAATAFIASMLGKVVRAGGASTIDYPAKHYLYGWCYATACEVVPYDPRSFSFMGSTDYDGNTLPATRVRVTDAVLHYKGAAHWLDPKKDVQYRVVTDANNTKTAGAFICVTYNPALLTIPLRKTSTPPNTRFQTGVNLRLTPQSRTNVINGGLRLVTPAVVGGAFNPANWLWYPSSGVAPVYKEQYQRVTVERRMLPVDFDISQLGKYLNLVNSDLAGIATANDALGNTGTAVSFPRETLRFDSFSTQYVQVPDIDANGEPDGFNRWVNIELNYDWRTTISKVVHDSVGALVPGVEVPVTWNHILAYPGTFSMLLHNPFAPNNTIAVAWWRAKYSKDSNFVDSDAYPTDVAALGAGADIMDTLWRQW